MFLYADLLYNRNTISLFYSKYFDFGFGLIFLLVSAQESSVSQDSSEAPRRRVREDYRVKYEYLDYAKRVDMKGLESLVGFFP